MNWKIWLHGLGAAAVGGVLGVATQIAADPSKFSLADWRHYAGAAAGAAVIAVCAYLAKSPLPISWDGVDRRTSLPDPPPLTPAPPPGAQSTAAGGKP